MASFNEKLDPVKKTGQTPKHAPFLLRPIKLACLKVKIFYSQLCSWYLPRYRHRILVNDVFECINLEVHLAGIFRCVTPWQQVVVPNTNI